jgi:DNA mismatch endonuclease, patch repair protein
MDMTPPTPERSRNMSRIRSSDTRPELAVRSLLHRLGFRFRLHQADLPGRPDVTLPSRRTVIFVHGCFWHRHAGCRLTTSPVKNKSFWDAKFQGNVARDARAVASLEAQGWFVMTIWQCELADMDVLADKLSRTIPARNL